MAVNGRPSGIFGHSKDNKSNMASLRDVDEKWAGKPGQGFRQSGTQTEAENWVVEDSHPSHQVWAVLLQSHLWPRVPKELLLLGIQGRLVGRSQGDGF